MVGRFMATLPALILAPRSGGVRLLSAADHRGARRSRAAGYAGLLFANLLPLALMLTAAAPQAWPALALTLLLRGWAGYDVASRTLAQRLNLRSWMLLPLQDTIGFCLLMPVSRETQSCGGDGNTSSSPMAVSNCPGPGAR